LPEQGSPAEVDQVSREILEYLVQHPDAKDTIEGIRQWWKPQGSREWRNNEVQTALDRLLARNWLIMRELSPMQKVYSVNKKHIHEIRASLLKS
jgi:hypothetical protein